MPDERDRNVGRAAMFVARWCGRALNRELAALALAGEGGFRLFGAPRPGSELINGKLHLRVEFEIDAEAVGRLAGKGARAAKWPACLSTMDRLILRNMRISADG